MFSTTVFVRIVAAALAAFVLSGAPPQWSALSDEAVPVAAVPAGLQGIRAVACPQTNYQQALAGTPDLQERAARAQATGVNDPSCTQHEPGAEARPLYPFLANTGTDRSAKFYDALCPQGRHLWLKQDPATLSRWEPCRAALAAAPESVLPEVPRRARPASAEIDCSGPAVSASDREKCRFVGVWITDSMMTTGITVNGVTGDGRVVGCMWGWTDVKWHKSDNSIGDPAQYDVARRYVASFSPTFDGRLTGLRFTIRIKSDGGVHDLTLSGQLLSGTYTGPHYPDGVAMNFHKTGQQGTNCPAANN